VRRYTRTTIASIGLPLLIVGSGLKAFVLGRVLINVVSKSNDYFNSGKGIIGFRIAIRTVFALAKCY
jgi:hypothetical protein